MRDVGCRQFRSSTYELPFGLHQALLGLLFLFHLRKFRCLAELERCRDTALATKILSSVQVRHSNARVCSLASRQRLAMEFVLQKYLSPPS